MIKTTDDEVHLKTNKGDVITLKSDKMSWHWYQVEDLLFHPLTAEELLSEKESGATFTDFDDAGTKTYTVNQSFTLDKDEAIYGLGQQQRGNLSLRNTKGWTWFKDNTDDYVPFLVFN